MSTWKIQKYCGKNHNSPWLNVKEHYIDVHSMFTLDGWTPFIPFVITSSYNLIIYHALGFCKANLERSNVTKYYKFLFLKSRVTPQTNKLFWPDLKKNRQLQPTLLLASVAPLQQPQWWLNFWRIFYTS